MTGQEIKAIFFDFMGTCLDWHTGAVSVLPQSLDEAVRSRLALEWRQHYFDSNTARLSRNEDPEDIDITLQNTLHTLLEQYPQHRDAFDGDVIDKCVARWHSMPAWPEVPLAMAKIKESANRPEMFVFANGTTRLQLDLCRSSGLSFDMLFSSALLGVYKPALESYQKTLELVKLKPEETVQVAAHVNDLRGAKRAGIKTIYIKRWTDDIEVDVDAVKDEFDYFLNDMSRLPEVLAELQRSNTNR